MEALLAEIKMREKMIEEIKGKVELYKECIEIIGLQETFSKFKDVTCLADIHRLVGLHEQT